MRRLVTYYCQQSAGFCREADHQDAAYYDALLRMVERAFRATTGLSANSRTIRNCLPGTLDHVRSGC